MFLTEEEYLLNKDLKLKILEEKYENKLFLNDILKIDVFDKEKLIHLIFTDEFFEILNNLNINEIYLPKVYNLKITGNTKHTSGYFNIKSVSDYYNIFILFLPAKSNFFNITSKNNLLSIFKNKNVIIDTFIFKNLDDTNKPNFKFENVMLLNRMSIYGVKKLHGTLKFTTRENKKFFGLFGRKKIFNHIENITLENIEILENFFDSKTFDIVTLKEIKLKNIKSIKNNFLGLFSSKSVNKINIDNIVLDKVKIKNKYEIVINRTKINKLKIDNSSKILLDEKNIIGELILNKIDNLSLLFENKVNKIIVKNTKKINFECEFPHNNIFDELNIFNLENLDISLDKYVEVFSKIKEINNIKNISLVYFIENLNDINNLIDLYFNNHNKFFSKINYKINFFKYNESNFDDDEREFINKINQLLKIKKRINLKNNEYVAEFPDLLEMKKSLENLYIDLIKKNLVIEIPQILKNDDGNNIHKLINKTKHKLNVI